MTFRFGAVELDVDAFELRRDGQRVDVEPQVFEVVRYLIEHRGRVVPKVRMLQDRRAAAADGER